MGQRRPLRAERSLKRTVKPRTPEPVSPEDFATTEKPIGMCRDCGHHTSAFCGACTAFVSTPEGAFTYCGCDCQKFLGLPLNTEKEER